MEAFTFTEMQVLEDGNLEGFVDIQCELFLKSYVRGFNQGRKECRNDDTR